MAISLDSGAAASQVAKLPTVDSHRTCTLAFQCPTMVVSTWPARTAQVDWAGKCSNHWNCSHMHINPEVIYYAGISAASFHKKPDDLTDANQHEV